MSQANAAARKRRAGGASLSDSPIQPASNQRSVVPEAPKSGLTLPQVIALVDKRLTTLETFMRDQTQNTTNTTMTRSIPVESESLNQLADEFNTKFEMLAGEVEALKDIVLKLQSYTMEVNKTLYEERIHMLSSDVSDAKEIVFDLSEGDE
jgi:hypothetical protein